MKGKLGVVNGYEPTRTKEGFVEGGKNPSKQRETLPVLQVPIRLTNIWTGKLNGIMDPLPF